MRLFVAAAVQDGGEIEAALRGAIRRYGEVDVHPSGPYWKIPAYLEFNVELTPSGLVDECLAALRGLAPRGWYGEVWNRPTEGDSFLDPRVEWAWVHGEEAATPPRFGDGEIVVVGDCGDARAEGLVGVRAVVGGGAFIVPAPSDGFPYWSYAVMPEGRDEMICFSESDLERTGEDRPPEVTPSTCISVSVNGAITGYLD